MFRRTLTAALCASMLAAATPAVAQAQPTELQFWHAFQGPLGEITQDVVNRFNASQPTYRLNAVYKGAYQEVLQAGIAAWRAGQAPHILMVYDIGTGTMINAGAAVKYASDVFQEAGLALDPAKYLAGVRGYYSLPDGRLASMPFAGSTALLWWNRDLFAKAGLPTDRAPATWPEVEAAAGKLKSAAPCALTVASVPWSEFEQYSAIHDLPVATKGNGFGGLDAELAYDNPGMVKHLARLIRLEKEGLFRYKGRDNFSSGVQAFLQGECAMVITSSASRADIARGAKFDWAASLLPFDPAVKAEPVNSLIGGNSLWTMTAPGRSAAEYKGVAAFYAFISQPENDFAWHKATGYVPITLEGYETARRAGYYDATPGADVAVRQLTRSGFTDNNRGIRLGRFTEIRNILQEEVERAFQGQQDAEAAMKATVSRSNRTLRDFQRSVGG